MAEFLSAGVFIEERQTDAQVVEAVSTSNMGIVGFSPKGPTDRARLVTSLDEYFRVFGGLTKKSLMGSQALAFFQNGGRRCFVVRVVPSDAVLADARVQNQITSQVIETGDGAATSYTKTSAASLLQDNGGLTPLVPTSFSLRYRAAGTAVTAQRARNDANTAFRTEATAVLAYSGTVDSKATRNVPGGTANGDVYYRSVEDGRTDITITHVDPTPTITPAEVVAVVGTAITVTLRSDGVAVTSTGATVAAAVGASAAASALVSASTNGTGLGLAAALATSPLLGVPVFDSELHRIVPGTLSVSWVANSVAKTIAFAGGDLTTPIATKTNVAGSKITLDLRTGRFSLLLDATEAPVLADAGLFFTFAYTPASATRTITTTGSVDASTGKMLLAGSTLAAPTLTNNYVNIIDGSYLMTFTAGASNIPHTQSALLATYKNNIWDLDPISKGVWANNVRIKTTGNVESYVAATASYSLFDITVEEINPDTGLFEPRERHEEVSFVDADAPSFFPDVLNQLSDLALVTDPGVHYQPNQLSGIARTASLFGGDQVAAGVALKTVVDALLPNAPLALRTVSITYTQASDGATRTITDDGNGNLTGAVNPAYAAPSTSGLAANKVNYTTGEVNFQTLTPVLAGSMIVVAYYSAPVETVHYERFGDATKAYTYTYNFATYSFYTSGSDGTFTSSTFSRAQFTEPSLQATLRGMYAFDRVDEILQLIIPDFAGDATVSQDMIAYAEQRATLPHGGDRFIILTVPRGSDPQAAVDWVRFALGVKSKYAAVYWPWVKFADPLNNNRPTVTPPLGHIAGIFARTDATRNVGKAPAGTVDGAILGITGLEQDPSQGQRDFVYPYRVNPLIATATTGRAVWGSRTIAAQSSWRNINAVRLFMFVEKSTYNSTFWTVFENNGPALWSRIKTQLSSFLNNLFSDGYFAGKNAGEAFFVIVDETNNSAATIDQGQVIIDVGMAPNKPAEFVRFRFQQITST